MSGSRESKDETQIREIIESWAKAVRDEDLNGILANHSAQILMFDLPSPTQLKGIDAYKKTWQPLFDWLQRSKAFDLSELNVTAGNDVAFATALIHCRGDGNERRKGRTRSSLDCRAAKIDGQWTVVHEHHSEPSR